VPFVPSDFYEFAAWLIETRQDEAALRTAISRIYYASHHLALQRLVAKGSFEPKGTGDDHQGVIRTLRKGKTTNLGNYLDSLRRLREHADYHVDQTMGDFCSLCKGKSPGLTEELHWTEAKTTGERFRSLAARL